MDSFRTPEVTRHSQSSALSGAAAIRGSVEAWRGPNIPLQTPYQPSAHRSVETQGEPVIFGDVGHGVVTTAAESPAGSSSGAWADGTNASNIVHSIPPPAPPHPAQQQQQQQIHGHSKAHLTSSQTSGGSVPAAGAPGSSGDSAHISQRPECEFQLSEKLVVVATCHGWVCSGDHGGETASIASKPGGCQWLFFQKDKLLFHLRSQVHQIPDQVLKSPGFKAFIKQHMAGIGPLCPTHDGIPRLPGLCTHPGFLCLFPGCLVARNSEASLKAHRFQFHKGWLPGRTGASESCILQCTHAKGKNNKTWFKVVLNQNSAQIPVTSLIPVGHSETSTLLAAEIPQHASSSSSSSSSSI